MCYVSRTLTPTKQCYAQIEKEALGVTWACERFRHFLLGKKFHVHTDHKPLVALLSHKQLDELTVRIQRFRMRLMRYHFTISHIPGRDLIIADVLSRAPVPGQRPEDPELEQVCTKSFKVSQPQKNVSWRSKTVSSRTTCANSWHPL